MPKKQNTVKCHIPKDENDVQESEKMTCWTSKSGRYRQSFRVRASMKENTFIHPDQEKPRNDEHNSTQVQQLEKLSLASNQMELTF